MNREERHEDEAPADPFGGVPVCLRGALERRGFSSLTSVQRRILENHTRGRNLRISSQTGSGKTVALGIALAETLERDPERRRAGPIALIVTPTRELAAQVSGELTWLFEDMKRVRVLVVTGGTSVLHEQRALKARPQVLVGTPGRLLDHLNSKSLDCADLEEVVLDEADQMLDMGFKDELDAIVDALPAARRSHLVSATFPREVVTLADRFAPDALSIEGTALGAAHLDIIHVANVLRRHDQYAALVNNLLMLGAGKSLIFVRTRADAAEVAELLGRDGFSALPLSGDLPQAQRTRTMNAFRHGTVRTLVATDVAARGIDV